MSVLLLEIVERLIKAKLRRKKVLLKWFWTRKSQEVQYTRFNLSASTFTYVDLLAMMALCVHFMGQYDAQALWCAQHDLPSNLIMEYNQEIQPQTELIRETVLTTYSPLDCVDLATSDVCVLSTWGRGGCTGVGTFKAVHTHTVYKYFRHHSAVFFSPLPLLVWLAAVGVDI